MPEARSRPPCWRPRGWGAAGRMARRSSGRSAGILCKLILAIEPLKHLMDQPARQGDLVECPALDPGVDLPRKGVSAAERRIQKSRPYERLRRRQGAELRQERTRYNFHLCQGGGRHGDDGVSEPAHSGLEAERSAQEHEASDILRAQRHVDGCKRAAQRVPHEKRPHPARLPRDRGDGLADSLLRVLGEPGAAVAARRRRPFEQVHTQTLAQAIPQRARRRREVPQVRPLDRRRDDEQHRPDIRPAVVTQAPTQA
jgi:hypothetical protein